MNESNKKKLIYILYSYRMVTVYLLVNYYYSNEFTVYARSSEQKMCDFFLHDERFVYDKLRINCTRFKAYFQNYCTHTWHRPMQLLTKLLLLISSSFSNCFPEQCRSII